MRFRIRNGDTYLGPDGRWEKDQTRAAVYTSILDAEAVQLAFVARGLRDVVVQGFIV